MSDEPTYKGPSAGVAFDTDGHLFFGRLARIEDGSGFDADNMHGLEAAFLRGYRRAHQRLAVA